MLFPFIFLLSFAFLHMPPNNNLAERLRFYSVRTHCFCILSSIAGPFVCPSTCQNAFFFSFFFVVVVVAGEGSSHILRLVQPNFPVWLWMRTRQIRGNLMTGSALVGILFLSISVQLWRLVPTSASSLSSHPVDDDKRQTHDHEDESQCSKACGLQERKERRQTSVSTTY